MGAQHPADSELKRGLEGQPGHAVLKGPSRRGSRPGPCERQPARGRPAGRAAVSRVRSQSPGAPSPSPASEPSRFETRSGGPAARQGLGERGGEGGGADPRTVSSESTASSWRPPGDRTQSGRGKAGPPGLRVARRGQQAAGAGGSAALRAPGLRGREHRPGHCAAPAPCPSSEAGLPQRRALSSRPEPQGPPGTVVRPVRRAEARGGLARRPRSAPFALHTLRPLPTPTLWGPGRRLDPHAPGRLPWKQPGHFYTRTRALLALPFLIT